MKYFLLFFLLIPLKLFGQCQYYYYYIGKPNAIIVDSFAVTPNDLYRIDIATVNIPDGFTIYNNKDKTDSLYFYIGSQAPHNPQKNSYVGYCEFEYDGDSLVTNVLRGNSLPSDFKVDSVKNYTMGCMRLYYWVPKDLCNFVFKVWGNTEYSTVYGVCITKLATGYINVRDTIYQPYCGKKNPSYLDGDCNKSLVVYQDYAIYDTPIVHHRGCDGDLGWIEFKNYPKFNKHNVGLGTFDIIVSNEYCQRKYNIKIEEKKICQYYIPNIFKINSNNNDRFILYTKNDHPYRLKIFDRWGGLIYEEQFITNVSGWDGNINGQPVHLGVYVYQIECLDLKLSGDVTIIK